MFTLHSSKSTIGRVAASLKFAVLLVLLGLIVVATERPMLLSPAGAVTTASQAAYVADQAGAKAAVGPRSAPDVAAAPSVDECQVYFRRNSRRRRGPVEDLPPQF